MKNREKINERHLSLAEDFSQLPAQTPATCNKDDVIDKKMLWVLGIILYKYNLRSITSSEDGDGEAAHASERWGKKINK